MGNKKRTGQKKAGGPACAQDYERDDEQILLDKADQLDRCSFISENINPDLASLLGLPPVLAREGVIMLLSNYIVIFMLVLASVLGPALEMKEFPSRPNLAAIYHLTLQLQAMISLNLAISATWTLSNFISIPNNAIYAWVTKSDSIFILYNALANTVEYLLIAAIIMRAWLGFESNTMAWVATVLHLGIWCIVWWGVFFPHQAIAAPICAQVYTKALAPWSYKPSESIAAIAKLTASMRDRAQTSPRTLDRRKNKFVSAFSGKDISTALEQYLSTLDGNMLRADLEEFLELVGSLVQRGSDNSSSPPDAIISGARLASTTALLAKKMFDQRVERELLNSWADEGTKSQ
jgi:hypothetical protein